MSVNTVGEMMDIYTDGSAFGSHGPGGWGAVILDGKRRRELSGSRPWTTISEMELMAASEAIRSVAGSQRIVLRSDSRYLIDGMNHLVYRWRRHGWKNSRGEPVQCRELWIELLALNQLHTIRWKWLRGHKGHRIQSRADALAYREACECYRSQPIAA